MKLSPLLLTLLLGLSLGCHQSVTPPPAPTTAASTPPAAELPEAEVLGALDGREWNVGSPAVRSLGPGAAPVLIRIADDDRPERIAYQRVRALLALRWHATPSVETFLLGFVAGDHDAPRLRAALESLSIAFGASDRDRVIAACQALSSHPDASVREAASRAEMQARVGRAMHSDPSAP